MRRLLLVITCLALLLPWYAQASHRSDRPLAEPASHRFSQRGYNQNEMFMDREYLLWLAENDSEAIDSRREYFKSLSEEERQKIKRAREMYRDLPDDKKRKLREEWDKKPAEEKANFRKWKDKKGKNDR